MRRSRNKVRVVFMCYLLALAQSLDSEPKCSRFDYEERLLEKMVRLEWQFERLQEEWRESRSAMVDGRAKVEIALQGHLERLVDAEEMARVSVSVSERRIEEVILNVTETANKALLKLDENIGAGYTPSSGKFTSPTSGLYMFTIQLCVEKDSSMYFELIKGGTDRLQMSRIYNAGSSQCNTADAFVMLAMNETVAVQATSSYSINIQTDDSIFWNTFAGVLLHQS
ncbi:uncharacterized protein LOC128213377 [Mya arenaria]|uniref:uncharacterized protein LOC128213377 n=1 Tax=Mya arenaria TaxID=6604 RepID=UPI0022DEF262|nr:uncharacterized protein LOC128213377 [Mya arenaria]